MLKYFLLKCNKPKKVNRKNLDNVLQILPVGISWLNKGKYFIDACLDGFGKPFLPPKYPTCVKMNMLNITSPTKADVHLAMNAFWIPFLRL